jgi:hypothetical protein
MNPFQVATERLLRHGWTRGQMPGRIWYTFVRTGRDGVRRVVSVHNPSGRVSAVR